MSYGITEYRIASTDLGRPLRDVLRAVCESTPAGRPVVKNPASAYHQCRRMSGLKTERLVGLYLDAQNVLVARKILSVGSLNTTRTHPREIMYPAIQNHALGFILVHNHPSGSLTPSVDDVEFTRSVRRVGELMGIDLYDHLIVSSRGFVSMKEKGLL